MLPGVIMNATTTILSQTGAGSRCGAVCERRPSSTRNALRDLFALADIRVDGERPWDLCVRNDRFYPRVLTGGTLALGESYMDGWWECEALDEMLLRAIRARLSQRLPMDLATAWAVAKSLVINLQSQCRARRVARQHYDLGNDFFQEMLDPDMQYSCAYFEGTADLAEAQRRKMELICRKLALQPGMRLVDIGCGWGGFAKYAAERYGCEVVGITLSREQQAHAAEACKGLPVEIRLQDYRHVTGRFDRAVSVGMMEHVGYKNYRTYMETVARCLGEDGLFLCHTIGRLTSATCADPWFTRYIFPNSMLPSGAQILRASEGCFQVEDLHNLGVYYDSTLMAWERNFRASWPMFAPRYGERFYRMWRYYLLGSAAAFRARAIDLYQFVFSKQGVPGGYVRPLLEPAPSLNPES